MNLKGKAVAITGAYSGLGAALSEAFAKKGCKLVLGGRNKEKLDNFAKKFNPTDTLTIVVDVRNEKDCKNFIDKAIEKFAQIDVLINNAGILGKFSNIEEVTEQELKDTFETNLFGVIFCCQAVAKYMKKQKSGTIINIGSTGMLNKELNEFGIKAFCFSPGGMKTNLFRNQSGRKTDEYMEPSFAAGKIIGILENPPEDWHIILRRSK